MNHPALQVAMRYLHLISLALIVGGVAFQMICLAPAARALDLSTAAPLLQRAAARFRAVFWISAAALVVSGTYNWVLSAETYRQLGAVGQALIGTKVLLALLAFAAMWAGSAKLIKEKACAMIVIHLAAAVMLLAAALRHFRLEHAHAALSGG